jgi:hypothetical protein
VAASDILQHFKAASARHRYIEQHDVHGVFGKLIEHFFSMRSLTRNNNVWCVRQNLFEALSNNRMVIGNERSYHYVPRTGKEAYQVLCSRY